MSIELFNHKGVAVSQYVGPELPFSSERRRYQITDLETGRLVTLSRLQWETLAEYITADCSTECEGPRLNKPLPNDWRWAVG